MVGNRLKKFRTKSGKTLEDISIESDLSVQKLSRIESGKSNISFHDYEKLSSILAKTQEEKYFLATGETYTDQPKESLNEVITLLKERNEELRSEIVEYKKREDRYLSILENFSLSQKTASQTPIKGTGELRDHPRKIKPRVESKAPG